jgi:hypothetical protein
MRASLAGFGAALAVAGAINVGAAAAQQQAGSEPPASENGRYAMTPSGDGFLRLDTRSGKVSLCVVKDGAARCTLAADEREAYEREIAALKAERGGTAPTGKSGEWGPRLPTDGEIDRTLGVMEKIWRGLNRIIAEDPPRPQGAPL